MRAFLTLLCLFALSTVLGQNGFPTTDQNRVSVTQWKSLFRQLPADFYNEPMEGQLMNQLNRTQIGLLRAHDEAREWPDSLFSKKNAPENWKLYAIARFQRVINGRKAGTVVVVYAPLAQNQAANHSLNWTTDLFFFLPLRAVKENRP